MALQCGIVGLPNVGKSTLFNALTRAAVPAENYPFNTIDPNIGVVPVPDLRLDAIAEIVQPKEVVPTAMEFVDIAGLVSGAAEGEGLGNKFLAHIRDVDAVVHVVRCFEDHDVTHVTGTVDPLADIETVMTELSLADEEVVGRAMNRFERRSRAGDKQAGMMAALLERVDNHLDTGSPARAMGLSREERTMLRELQLLTLKPTMYVANVGESSDTDNHHVKAVRSHAVAEGADLVVIRGSIEAEIAQLDEADKLEFLAEVGEREPGLNRVIRAAYHLLDLGTFFTAGDEEARAWTFRHGMRAPQAAGRIHTDFEAGFIRAEVISYDDFVAYNGEAGAKEAGKWRLEGKDYVVAKGDLIYFRFNL
jgi:ribosome-binding ATPase